MVKRTQLKFFALITAVLFISFSILFGTVSMVFRSFCNRSILGALEQIENSYNFDEHPLPESIIVQVYSYSQNNPEKADYNVVSAGGFSQDEIFNLVKDAVKNSHLSVGNLDQLHYKIVKHSSTSYDMIIFSADMSEYTQKLKSGILNTLLFMTIIFVIVTMIAWSLSQSIITPVKLAFEKQRQFISDASHELKTPIAIISANSDILITSEKDNVFVNNIKSQTDRMHGLVSDLLTLAKIDEHIYELKHETFNLSQEVLATTLPFDSLAFTNGKIINTEISPDIEIKGDKQSVKNLLTILLDNAIKHSSANAIIDVTLKKEGKTILSVTNTGSNVPDEDSDKVFERFYRGDSSRSRSSGGSGLGLAIAKTIADTNNWKISAHSQFNKSMKITVVF